MHHDLKEYNRNDIRTHTPFILLYDYIQNSVYNVVIMCMCVVYIQLGWCGKKKKFNGDWWMRISGDEQEWSCTPKFDFVVGLIYTILNYILQPKEHLQQVIQFVLLLLVEWLCMYVLYLLEERHAFKIIVCICMYEEKALTCCFELLKQLFFCAIMCRNVCEFKFNRTFMMDLFYC